MNFKASDFARRPRDSRWERDLAAWLRTLTEAERLAFLEALSESDPLVSLDLAHKTLREPASFVRFLDDGLRSADVSSIRFWLRCVVPRLGFKTVVRLLHSRLGDDPAGVDRAVYFLPEFAGLPGYSREAVEGLREALDHPVR